MIKAELERQAIGESVRLTPYSLEWPALFRLEFDRLLAIAPELMAVEHVGSTAVPGLAAKPIIDIMAVVANMAVADLIVNRLCENDYITSAKFNRSLVDRRWLMRHAGGHRTHHLHLVLGGSQHWTDAVRFRNAIREDGNLAARYTALKRRLAVEFVGDREAYGNAKSAFIAATLSTAAGQTLL